jgi:hypothetical protein
MLPDGHFVGPISRSDETAVAATTYFSEIRVVINWFDELQKKVPAAR